MNAFFEKMNTEHDLNNSYSYKHVSEYAKTDVVYKKTSVGKFLNDFTENIKSDSIDQIKFKAPSFVGYICGRIIASTLPKSKPIN